MNKTIHKIAILLLILMLSGCATHHAWVQYELYLGLSTDSGRVEISDDQWLQFQNEIIVPRFPEGFTVHHAYGFWCSGTTPYSEQSNILVIVAPRRGDAENKIRAIAREYAQRFQQDAVLQVKTPADVLFIEADDPAN